MINEKQLYFDLMNLADHPESGFYYRDEQVGDITFRIFLYRITSYQWWCKPGALYSRGTVYDVTDINNPKLASLCMPKFFNIGENPMAVQWDELDLINVHSINEKHDGSLITVFEYNGKQYTKSKGSFSSSQAIAASKLLPKMHLPIGYGYSTNLEYCSPSNLIVVRYPDEQLNYLNSVNHTTGAVVFPMSDYHQNKPLSKFVADVKEWKDKEGVVVYLDDSKFAFKMKSDWYLSLHRMRDDVNNPKRIVEAVFAEAVDDMKLAFPEFQKYITDIETKVTHFLGQVYLIEREVDFWLQEMKEANATQRDVAIAAKQSKVHEMIIEVGAPPEFHNPTFAMIMAKFNGKPYTLDKFKSIILDYFRQPA